MWTLKVGGDERPLSGWGISGAVFSRASGGRDVLTLQTTEALSAAPQWTRRQTAELFWSGQRWLWGLFVEPRTRAGAGRQGRAYELEGASWFLRMLPMTQKWDTEEGEQDHGRVILFGGAQDTLERHLVQMVEHVIDAGGYLDHGSYGFGFTPPPEKVGNMMCSSLLQRLMGYMVAGAQWFDYTDGGPPIIHCTNYDSLPALTLSGGAAELEVGETWEQQPTQIIVSIKRQVRDKETGTVKTLVYQHSSPADAVPFGNFGTVLISLNFQEGMSAARVNALADYIWEGLGQVRWRGQLRYCGAAPHPGLRPGTKLNIVGRQPEWARMGALIQQTALDLFTLSTQVTFGPPQHLGPDDLAGLMRVWRSRVAATPGDIEEQATGESETFNMGDHSEEDKRQKGKGDEGKCCCGSAGGGTPGG